MGTILNGTGTSDGEREQERIIVVTVVKIHDMNELK